jgi:uncharacterized protein
VVGWALDESGDWKPNEAPEAWTHGRSSSPLEVSWQCAHISVWCETHTWAILSAVSPSFEWDPAKDAQNQRKHGVAFMDAQLAFLDPERVIAKDLSHSKGEPRFYCFGETGGGVLTVRFAYRGDVIRIIGAGY